VRFENLKPGDQVWVVFEPFTDPEARPLRPGYYPVIEVTETRAYFDIDQSKESAAGNLGFSLQDGSWVTDQDVLPTLTYTVYNSEKEWNDLQNKTKG